MNHEIMKCKYVEKKSNQVFDAIQIMCLLSFSFKFFLEIQTLLQNI